MTLGPLSKAPRTFRAHSQESEGGSKLATGTTHPGLAAPRTSAVLWGSVRTDGEGDALCVGGRRRPEADVLIGGHCGVLISTQLPSSFWEPEEGPTRFNQSLQPALEAPGSHFPEGPLSPASPASLPLPGMLRPGTPGSLVRLWTPSQNKGFFFNCDKMHIT